MRIASKPSSRFVIALVLFLLLLALPVPLFSRSALAAPGDLDPTFGSGGLVTTSIGDDSTGYATALQSDGKVLVAGTAIIGSSYDFALARYQSNGSLDTSFGSGGKVTTDFAGGTDWAHAVALQPDGKIVAAGWAVNSSGNGNFALARYNSNGSLDTTFDGDGKVTTDFAGDDDQIYAMALQPDGKIVVAGYATLTGGHPDFGVARYNSDGSLDNTFDTDGKVTTNFGDADSAYALALQPDGKIVVAGSNGNWVESVRYSDFTLVRYNSDGSLDTTFDTDGKVTTDFGAYDAVTALALQPDGKIIAAGLAKDTTLSDYHFALARYNSDGSLDTDFDTDGMVTTDIAGGDDEIHGIALQSDGKIVAAGEAGGDFVLARYNSAGGLDTSFSSDGLVTTDILGSGDYGYAVVLQSDGRIVVAGNALDGSRWDFALARYNAAESVPASTNADLSGLVLSSGTLAPAFDSATTAYTASVANIVPSLTVTPTAADAGASLQARVNSGGWSAVTSGSPSGALSLNVGDNAVNMQVTAADGTTTKTYTVTVTRATTLPVITEGSSVAVTISKDGSPVSFDLTLHASDADGDPLTWGISTPAGHGTASAGDVAPCSGTDVSQAFDYTPDAGYVGSDSFAVQVDDQHGGTDAITVNVAILGDTWIGTGPERGWIRALAIDPPALDILYAGTNDSGVFKSTDGGGHWSAVNTGLTSLSVNAIAIDPATPTTLYAGTEAGGVFKSTNGGGTWSAANTGLATPVVYTLAINPTTPSTLYAGTLLGVFKSTNSGGNWAAVNTGLTSLKVLTLAIDPVTPTTLYAGTEAGGVFKTTNGGGNWSAVNTGLTTISVYTLAINPATPTTLYAGTYGGGVFKSTNGGGTWNAANTGLIYPWVYTLAIDPATPTTLYAGTAGNGIFKSTDGGGTWNTVNAGLNIPISVWALAIDPVTPATLYAGTYGSGVFESTDGGANWNAVNTGLTATQVNALAVDPPTTAVLYAGTDYGVFKSTDGGASWRPVNMGAAYPYIWSLAIDPVTPATLYAGAGGGGDVFKSTDGGGIWSTVDTGLVANDIFTLAINPATPATLYAGTNNGIFKSTNGGGTWNPVNTGLGNKYVRSLAIDPLTPATLYAGTAVGVFKSTNGGGTWVAAKTGLPGLMVHALAIDPVTPAILYAGTWEGAFKSTNGGGSWSVIKTGLTVTSVQALAVDPTTPTTLYAGTSGGVFQSLNGGGNWTALSAGLTNPNVSALAVDPATPANLYAGAPGGVFAIRIDNPVISGSLGVNGAGGKVTYTGGFATADGSGLYSFVVPYGWAGTVTPSKTNFTFSPGSRSYSGITTNQSGQDYTPTYVGPGPSAPLLVQPLANALVDTLTPTLTWSVVTLPAGTSFDHYQLQVSTNVGFTALVLDKADLTDKTSPTFTLAAGESLHPNTRYYWRVQAQNTFDKYGDWSAVRYFRTALPAPISLSTDGTQNLRPMFAWDMPVYPLPAATSFTVQISKFSSFSPILLTGTATGKSYTPVADLPRGTTFYWQVRANGANGPSAWTLGSSYATGNPPNIPTLLTPVSNTLVPSYKPELDWNDSTLPTTPPGAASVDHYRVQVDDHAGFSSTVVDQTVPISKFQSTDYLTSLSANTRYYWHVQACNTTQCSDWSAVRYFRTLLPAPTGLSADNSVQNLRPLFNWSMPLDLNPGPTGYTVQVTTANVAPFTIVVTGNPTTIGYIPLRDLPRNQTLYVRVQAKGANGPSDWSDFVSFTTGNPPGIPVLVSPANNALVTTLTPNLSWNVVTGATGYHVVVATDAAFTAVVRTGPSGTTNWDVNPALLSNNLYYWRAQACNGSSECSDWSAAHYFRTAIAPPTLLSPADGTGTPVKKPVFDWNDPAGATGYTIQIARGDSFMSLVGTYTVVHSTYTPLTNLAPGTYYWRVRANGLNGPSAWSTGWSITIVSPDIVGTNFTLQISKNVSFSPILSTLTVTGKSYMLLVDLPRGTKFYW